MKLGFVLPWWLGAVTTVKAGTVRKRRSALQLYEPEDESNDRHLQTSLLVGEVGENDIILDLRFEDMSFSMSMPSPPEPTVPTSAPSASPTLSDREKDVVDKCNQTSLERSRDILSILSTISEEASLLIVGTPQFEARLWLDESDSAIICADQPELVAQRYRAAVLYFSLGGSEWTTNVGWLSGSSECEWFGIDCNEYDFAAPDTFFPITSIDLNENNLQGDLPVEAFGLIKLEKLLMQKNSLSSSIPSEIGNLQELQELDLDENQLKGALPLTLYTLPEINKIDLNSNQLSGELSQDVGNLSKLQVLQIEDNQFSGTIPVDALVRIERLGTFVKAWIVFDHGRFKSKLISFLSIIIIIIICIVVIVLSGFDTTIQRFQWNSRASLCIDR
jgi:hypothetical protein